MSNQRPNHWLSGYANKYHTWHRDVINGKDVYRRPLGQLELSFDTDGAHFGGRSDMFALMKLEIRHSLSKEEFRRRIILAWASLRVQHVLLMSRIHQDEESGQRDFVVELYKTKEQVLDETAKMIVFLEDHYDKVDASEFHRHSLNVARILDPEECLSKVFVLPLEQLPNGNLQLYLHIIMGHQTTDGVSSYSWWSHFLRIMNTPTAELERDIDFFKCAENISSRLPPAQENLYPPVPGNKARQLWFWAIMRILRHVQKPLPPTFMNPLRRDVPLVEAVSLPPVYSKVFDYSPEGKPPLNSFHCNFPLSQAASQRVIQLSREANVSIGAGGFALVAVAMMELEEARHPNIPASERRPFAAGFPLNPRMFFGYTGPPDSCMLSFCEGIVLPFLPSDLPFEGRLKLMAKIANRQLKVYQKRLKPIQNNIDLGPHSPHRMLANGYLFQIERLRAKLPDHQRKALNPQGSYPASTSTTGSTCGISSLGSIGHIFRPGMYDLNDLGYEKDFVVDFRDVKMGVRSRNNEFLVGSSSNWQGILGFGISYDGNVISEGAASVWEEKVKTLLEKGQSRL